MDYLQIIGIKKIIIYTSTLKNCKKIYYLNQDNTTNKIVKISEKQFKHLKIIKICSWCEKEVSLIINLKSNSSLTKTCFNIECMSR